MRLVKQQIQEKLQSILVSIKMFQTASFQIALRNYGSWCFLNYNFSLFDPPRWTALIFWFFCIKTKRTVNKKERLIELRKGNCYEFYSLAKQQQFIISIFVFLFPLLL